MKKYYVSLFVIILIIFSVTILAISNMPTMVPMHFDLQGNVNRYGNRMENLIFPTISLLLALFLSVFANYQYKRQQKHDAKLMMSVAIAVVLMFGVMQCSFLYVDVFGIEYASDILKVPLLCIGCLLVFLGFIMPSSEINPYFGVRLPWTMKSVQAWKKSQKVAGSLAIVFGLLMLISAFILTNSTAVIGLIILLFSWVIIVIIVTYVVCRNIK